VGGLEVSIEKKLRSSRAVIEDPPPQPSPTSGEGAGNPVPSVGREGFPRVPRVPSSDPVRLQARDPSPGSQKNGTRRTHKSTPQFAIPGTPTPPTSMVLNRTRPPGATQSR
jgi:hypothetical protein